MCVIYVVKKFKGELHEGVLGEVEGGVTRLGWARVERGQGFVFRVFVFGHVFLVS